MNDHHLQFVIESVSIHSWSSERLICNSKLSYDWLYELLYCNSKCNSNCCDSNSDSNCDKWLHSQCLINLWLYKFLNILLHPIDKISQDGNDGVSPAPAAPLVLGLPAIPAASPVQCHLEVDQWRCRPKIYQQWFNIIQWFV